MIGRCPFNKRASVGPLFFWKGGNKMITYSDLFTYTLVIIGIFSVAVQLHKKK